MGMTDWTLIKDSARHYWRSNMAVALGVAVAVAVLVGSLLVGDSVRGSLRNLALDRLGEVDHVLVGPGFFREELAEELGGVEGAESVVPALIVQASARNPGSDVVVPRVDLIGVRDDFWKLHDGPEAELGGRSVSVNRILADDADISAGDSLILNVGRQGAAPRESAFGRRGLGHTVASVRVTVDSILAAEGAGKFTLRNDEPTPRSVFVDLDWLQSQLDQDGRVSALLIAGGGGESLREALKKHATPADYGLRLVRVPEYGYVSLESEELVLPPRIVAAAQAESAQAEPTSIYLANSIRPVGDADREVPYSVVVGLDPGAAPPLGPLPMQNVDELPELGPDDVLLNRWTVERLDAGVGQKVALSYYQWSKAEGLKTAVKEFRVAGVVAMEGRALDRNLVPAYEGITDAETIGDWDPPFPIEYDRIGPEDEDYWAKYRTAPKAFVAPSVAREFWTGSTEGGEGWVTSVRLAPENGDLAAAERDFAAGLMERLPPREYGLRILPVKSRALEAAQGSTDFRMLFVSLSMFLIAAAAALVGLMLRLTIQRRSGQFGILEAVGFDSSRASRILLGEAFLVSLAGALVGAPLGIGYAKAIIWGLQTRWQGVIGEFPLSLHVTAVSVIGGAVGGLVVALVAIWWALRMLRKTPALDLLTGWRALAAKANEAVADRAGWIGIGALVLAGVLLAASGVFGLFSTTAAFFGGGTALLIGILSLLLAFLARPRPRARRAPSLLTLAWRGGAENWLRSLLTIAVLACASFIIVTVAANRRDTGRVNTRRLDSGAGGFNLVARSALPIYQDLSTDEGRRELGFQEEESRLLAECTILSLRVSEGDDISCLNLQMPTTPRVVGLPERLIERGGFTFSNLLREPEDGDNPWRLLTEDEGGAVPAFADAASAQWILKVGLGDVVEVPGRQGQSVKLRLVGLLQQCIFASEILVSEEQFESRIAADAGYRYFLIRTPSEKQAAVADALRGNLGKIGLDVVPTTRVLARYARVQDTYLGTFATLGGLGLLLGTLGIVTVLLRGVVERRGELALLLALGFGKRRVVGLVIMENGVLLAAGLLSGTVAALVAVAPHLASGSAQVRWGSLVATLAACFGIGLVSCFIAAASSVRSELLSALRRE